MSPVRVHFDFNDLSYDGTAYVLPKHADGALELGADVELYDADGNTMQGIVRDLNAGQHGRLVSIDPVPGTWKDHS